jgi:hypothetical protein
MPDEMGNIAIAYGYASARALFMRNTLIAAGARY